MKMVSCPECGETITPGKPCPNCTNNIQKPPQHKKSTSSGCIKVFFLITVLGLFAYVMTEYNTDTSRTDSEPNTTHSASTQAQPLSTEEALMDLLENENVYQVVAGTQLVSIYFDISDNLSNDMIKDGVKMDVRWILKKLDETGYSFQTVDITGRFPMRDVYGNTEEQEVVELRYRQANLDRVNWDNFLWENVYEIADYVWLHPAFQ